MNLKPCFEVVGLVAKLCPTLTTLWTVACQAHLPIGFSRQGYWSGLPFPSPGNLPNPGIEPASPALQADALLTVLQGKPKLVHFPVSHTFLRRYQNTRLLTDLPKGS